jgi:hypothetical protein
MVEVFALQSLVCLNNDACYFALINLVRHLLPQKQKARGRAGRENGGRSPRELIIEVQIVEVQPSDFNF